MSESSLVLCSNNIKDLVGSKDFELALEAVHSLSAEISRTLSSLLVNTDQLTIQQVTALSNSVALHNRVIQAGILEARKLTQREEIDFNHPKIQKSYGFLMDAVFKVLREIGIDETTIDIFANNLARDLIGFEEKLNSTFKKTSLNVLDKLENPLVKKVFNNNVVDVN